MPLESGSYLSNLVITNPTSGDPKSQGDDHLRLIKATLKVTFSGFLGAVIVTGTDTGTGAAYVVNPSTAIPSLQYGMRVVFTAVNASTGPATLAVSGLAATPIIHGNGSALVAGDLLAGRVVEVVYDGTSFQIVGGSGYVSRTGNQTINGSLTLNGGGLTSTGAAVFSGVGASSFGGAVTFGGAGTFGGGLTATGPLVLIGSTGNVTAPGTGTNDFSAGATKVRTMPYGSPDSLDAVSQAALNAAMFQSVLPAQTVTGPKFLRTFGGIATWEPSNVDLPLMNLGIY